MSNPANNPKSDTAKSAALEIFGLGFHYGAKAALSHVGFDVVAGRFKGVLVRESLRFVHQHERFATARGMTARRGGSGS